MDRCALFVDAGYVLADGAMAVHGTRRRESVSWDYPGLLQLLASLAMERSRVPLLRCYWYDSTVEGRRSADHDALADLPGVKLRLAKMRPGRREGVEGEIHRDLTTLARNKAVSDAMVVSGEEDLAQVIADVQDMGMRVTLLHIASDGNAEIPRALRQECDDIVQISASQLRPFAELISGAEPPRRDDRDGGMLAIRAGSNGNGNGNGTGTGTAMRTAGHCSGASPSTRPSGRRKSGRRLSGSPPRRTTRSPTTASSRTTGRSTTTAPARTTALRSPTTAPDLPFPTSRPRLPPGGRSSRPGPRRPRARTARRGPNCRNCPPGTSCTGRRSPSQRGPPEDLTAERAPARPRQEPEMLRPVESGYNPGAVREQFQLDAVSREPHPADAGDRYQPVPVPVPVPVPAAVPAGAAAIRRLPVHNGAQTGQQPGQPSPAQGPSAQGPLGQGPLSRAAGSRAARSAAAVAGAGGSR